jgi:inhibitor of the pro-sigma K processing machinery
MQGLESAGIFLAFGAGLLLLYLLGGLLLVPLKWILKLIFNALIGGVLLWLVQLIGAPLGLHIVINPLNALIVGILGLPGMIMVVLLQVLL